MAGYSAVTGILQLTAEYSATSKLLGVMLSSTFTWSDHIEYISCKVNKTLVFYVGLSIIYLMMPGYFFIIA